MNRGGLFLLVLSVIIAIGITWLNSSWLTYKDFTITKKVKEIDYYLTDFTLLNTQADGQMRYFITAQHLIHQQTTGTSEIFKPLLQARDTDGTMITLKSDKAEQDIEGLIRLRGDVSVVKTEGKREQNFELLTRDLVYNPKQKTLSSKSKLQFTSSQGRLEGVGFSTSLEEQALRIDSHVHAQFTPAQ